MWLLFIFSSKFDSLSRFRIKMPLTPSHSPQYNDCGSEMSDCSSMEEGRDGSTRRGNNILTIRQDRKARRVESNNRERRRMHELNHAFQVTFNNDL